MPALPGYYTTKEAKIPCAQNLGRMWFIPVEWVERMENEPIDPKGNRGLARESKK